MPQTDQPRRILIVGASDCAEAMAAARRLPAGGRLLCIERDRDAAARAVAAFAQAGLADRVSVMIGEPSLFVKKVAGPFDLILIARGTPLHERATAYLHSILAPGGAIRDLQDGIETDTSGLS